MNVGSRGCLICDRMRPPANDAVLALGSACAACGFTTGLVVSGSFVFTTPARLATNDCSHLPFDSDSIRSERTATLDIYTVATETKLLRSLLVLQFV